MVERGELTRRSILASSIAVILGFAGCGEPTTRLLALDLELKSKGPDFVFELKVSNISQGNSNDWRTFNDVRIVGYDDSNSIVCRHELGTVVGAQSFELKCSSLPRRIELRAQETPCDASTDIEQAVYTGDGESNHVWAIERRDCTTE